MIDLDRLKRRLWQVVEEEIGPAAKVAKAAVDVGKAVKDPRAAVARAVRKSKGESIFDAVLEGLDMLGGSESPDGDRYVDVEATVSRGDEETVIKP